MEAPVIPDFVLYFEGKDITKDLRPYILELRYTDNVSAVDDLSIVLDNSNKEFTNASFPTPNLEIKLYIKHLKTREYIYCGTFKRDNLKRKLYTTTIKALSIVKKSTIKTTKKNRTFQNTSLSQIVSQIATENSLTPVIKQTEDLQIKNILQQNETDSQFIEKLAKKYGYLQKITPDKLFFIQQEELENQEPIEIFKENDLIDCDLDDNTAKIYKGAVVYYHDPKENKDFKYEYIDPNIEIGEILKINQKVENTEEAKKLAISMLKQKNKFKQSGSITVEGNPLLVAGATVELDLGDKFSGKYFIESSTHTVGQQGYTTTLQIRKIF